MNMGNTGVINNVWGVDKLSSYALANSGGLYSIESCVKKCGESGGAGTYNNYIIHELIVAYLAELRITEVENWKKEVNL